MLLNQVKQYVLILAIKGNTRTFRQNTGNDEMVFDRIIHNQITNINAWICHS